MAEEMIYVQIRTSKHTFRAPLEDKDSASPTCTVNCAKPLDFQLFSPVPFLFLPLMNSSSVRANNRDSSTERADNRAAILTGIKRSEG